MWGFTIGLAAALLAVFSQEAMSAAAESAALFMRGVMPALFPMLVLSSLPTSSSREPLCLTLVFSLLAGSPASMKRVRGLYDAGGANGARLTTLLGATGVMSPMFFIGTLAAWTGQPDAAWRMLIAHWAGAALSGLAGGGAHRLAKAARRAKGTERPHAASHKQENQYDKPAGARRTEAVKPQSLIRALPAALSSAVQSLLAVCAAMMLFSIVAAILRALLMRALPEQTAQSATLPAVLWAALEIGGGSAELVRLGASLPLICALCGLGGLSLLIQNLLFTGDMVKPARLLALRAAHAAFSYVICALLL